jgi:hypothetical protein
MDINSIVNDTTVVGHIPAEQHSYVNHRQDENSIQNPTNSQRNIRVTNNVKKTPMPPTPLYRYFTFFLNHHNNLFIREYSYWSTHSAETAVCAFSLFTSRAMAVGVLTACFTSVDSD